MLGGTRATGKPFARIFLHRADTSSGCRSVCLTCQGLAEMPIPTKNPGPSPGKRLRNAWQAGPIAVPGAFNALTARLVEQFGFRAVYLSGGALSAASGVPDIGLLTLTEFADEARRLTAATSLPLLCDADTGFGEAINVERTVQEFES